MTFVSPKQEYPAEWTWPTKPAWPTKVGVTLRFVRGYDITNNRFIRRFDILWGPQ